MTKKSKLSKRADELFKFKGTELFEEKLYDFVSDNVDLISGMITNATKRGFGEIGGERHKQAVAEGWILVMSFIRDFDPTHSSGMHLHSWLSTKCKYGMIDLARKHGKFTRADMKVLKALEEVEIQLLRLGIHPTPDNMAEHMIENKVASRKVVERIIFHKIPSVIAWSDFSASNPDMGQPFSMFDENGDNIGDCSSKSRDIKTSDEWHYRGTDMDYDRIGSMSRMGYSKEDIADEFGMDIEEFEENLAEGLTDHIIDGYADHVDYRDDDEDYVDFD